MALIVIGAFVLAFLYSMFCTKNRSRDVYAFECGIKRTQRIGKIAASYKADLFPIVSFLVFDAIFIFLLAFVFCNNSLKLYYISNLLTIMIFPIIGFIFVLVKKTK